MKNKILSFSSKTLLIILTTVFLTMVVLALILSVLNVSNIILQVVLIVTICLIIFGFFVLNNYIISPIESLYNYLQGDTSELPNLIALDLNKELSDIVYEVNNIQANLLSQSTQAHKQIQSIVTNEENADFFSNAMLGHMDGIQRTLKQVQYQAESKDEYQEDLKKECKKFQTKLVQLTNKQKNNVEFLNETQKILTNSNEIVVKSNRMIDENINQIHDVKKVFLDFENIAERVNELSFNANLLAINTQVETTKLGSKGEALKKITTEWQQLASYNVQTSKLCKLFLDDSKLVLSSSTTGIEGIQKRLLKLNSQLDEGVMNSSTDITEAKTVLDIITNIQEEADNLEKVLFKNTSKIKEMPRIFSKISDVKQTLKAWSKIAKNEQEVDS